MAKRLSDLTQALSVTPPAHTVTTLNVLGAEWTVQFGGDDDEDEAPTYWVDFVQIGGRWFTVADVFTSEFCAALDAALTQEFRDEADAMRDSMAEDIAAELAL